MESPEACGQTGSERELRASQVLRTLPCIGRWAVKGMWKIEDRAQVLLLRRDAGIGGESRSSISTFSFLVNPFLSTPPTTVSTCCRPRGCHLFMLGFLSAHTVLSSIGFSAYLCPDLGLYLGEIGTIHFSKWWS